MEVILMKICKLFVIVINFNHLLLTSDWIGNIELNLKKNEVKINKEASDELGGSTNCLEDTFISVEAPFPLTKSQI